MEHLPRRLAIAEPIVPLLQDRFLDPDAVAAAGLEVRVVDPQLKSGMTLSLRWFAASAVGDVVDVVRTVTLGAGIPGWDEPTHTFTFLLSQEEVHSANGGHVLLNVELIDGSSTLESPRLAFRVGRLAPVPLVQFAHDLKLYYRPATSALAVTAPPFSGLRVGDIATLHGWRAPGTTKAWSFTVGAGHLGGPLSWEVENSFIVAAINRAVRFHVAFTLKAAGPGGADATVTFAPQQLDVVNTAVEFAPPIVLPKPGEVINPAAYTDGLPLALPSLAQARWGDTALIRALPSGGQGAIRQVWALDLTSLGSGYAGLRLPHAWLLIHDGDTVTLDWQLSCEGACLQGEPLDVEIRSPWAMTAPDVEGATAEGADGDDVEGYAMATSLAAEGVYVRVPAAVSPGPTDTLQVHFEGDPNGGRYVADRPTTDDDHRFNVPAQYIGPNIGPVAKRFPVYYSITPAGGEPQVSGAYRLWIKKDGLSLQNVACEPIRTGATISLSEVASAGRLTITQPRWPFFQVGQRVQVLVIGVAPNGGDLSTTVFEGPAPENLQFELSPEALSAFRTNEALEVDVTVAYDTVTDALYKKTPFHLVP